MADEMRSDFELIQFKRGLAMLDYIKAKRQYRKMNKEKIQKFKDLIKSSALLFNESHEFDGIEQCIYIAKSYLTLKAPQNNNARQLKLQKEE